MSEAQKKDGLENDQVSTDELQDVSGGTDVLALQQLEGGADQPDHGGVSSIFSVACDCSNEEISS